MLETGEDGKIASSRWMPGRQQLNRSGTVPFASLSPCTGTIDYWPSSQKSPSSAECDDCRGLGTTTAGDFERIRSEWTKEVVGL